MCGVEKGFAALYIAAEEPQFVDVPCMRYIAIDGKGGEPSTSSEFQGAVVTLYTTAYAISAMAKAECGKELPVAALETLWWSEGSKSYEEDRDAWYWKLMLPLADHITDDLVQRARDMVAAQDEASAVDKLSIVTLDEGRAVQLLYTGSYDNGAAAVKKLHQFIRDAGCSFDRCKQKHHDIYLDDPNRVAPEKLRTIIRQPVV